MKFLNKIHQKINQVTLKSILSDTMSNIRYNRIYTKNCSSIAELRGKHLNKIGIVVGSGPSLRKKDQSKYLKLYRKNFFIIACDGALYYLLNKGIVPDLVVTLDPHPTRIARWFGDKTLNLKTIQKDNYFRRQDLEIKFQNELKSNREMIKLFDKHANKIKIAICTSSSKLVAERLLKSRAKLFWWNPFLDDTKKKNSLSKKIFKMNKLPLINTGGNVGSASWMIADQVFGFENIVLLGMDYSYYIDTPISSTQYYDAIEKVTKDKIEMRKFYKKITNPHMKKTFYTDHVYLWYRKNFFEMIENTDSSTINCSQAGILFNKRIVWTSLKKFCNKNL